MSLMKIISLRVWTLTSQFKYALTAVNYNVYTKCIDLLWTRIGERELKKKKCSTIYYIIYALCVYNYTATHTTCIYNIIIVSLIVFICRETRPRNEKRTWRRLYIVRWAEFRFLNITLQRRIRAKEVIRNA